MSENDRRDDGLTGRQAVGAGAAAAATALLSGTGVEQALAAKGGGGSGGGDSVAGMNVILFITDQERAIQHFPQNWLRKNLPAPVRLIWRVAGRPRYAASRRALVEGPR